MCDRLACTLVPPELRKACAYRTRRKGRGRYERIEPTYLKTTHYTYMPLYNLCPSQVVPVLADKIHFPETKEITCSDYVILPMRWGMLPRWTIQKSMYHTHNAKLETALDSNFFKPEFNSGHRCVILCDGYYEWQTTRADKQPYYIYQENIEEKPSDDNPDGISKPLLKLAGVFSSKVDEEGVRRYSCSIITKAADNRLSWLHDRMPIMLETFHDVERWISWGKLNCDQSFQFLTTYGDVQREGGRKSNYILKYHSVDKKYVNDSSCTSKKCIEHVNVKRQNTLDNWLVKRPATGK